MIGSLIPDNVHDDEDASNYGPEHVTEPDDQSHFTVSHSLDQLFHLNRGVVQDFFLDSTGNIDAMYHIGDLGLEPSPQRITNGRFDSPGGFRREPVSGFSDGLVQEAVGHPVSPLSE